MQTRFDEKYYEKQYKYSFFRERGDKPGLYSFWCRHIGRKGNDIKVLDIGCGEGDFLKRACGGFFTVGIDVSFYAVKQANSRVKGGRFLASDALRLPFKDASFDVVTAFDVAEHLKDPALFFNCASRVLKPGGELIFSTPNPGSFGARRKKEKWFGYGDETHISIKTMDDWWALVKAAGFTIARDGTDTLWDVPYFRHVPAFVQRLVFLGIHHAVSFFNPFFPWEYGENYICIARKE